MHISLSLAHSSLADYTPARRTPVLYILYITDISSHYLLELKGVDKSTCFFVKLVNNAFDSVIQTATYRNSV